MDDIRFSECCYYLRRYGSPGKMVSFLARNNCWNEACSNILDKVGPVLVIRRYNGTFFIGMSQVQNGHLHLRYWSSLVPRAQERG